MQRSEKRSESQLHNRAGATSKAAPSGRVFKEDLRPTYDQIYLASRLSDIAPQGHLTMAAMQKLNSRYGVAAVTSALRSLHGFPPKTLGSPYAYIKKVLDG